MKVTITLAFFALGVFFILAKGLYLNPDSSANALLDKKAMAFNVKIIQSIESLPKTAGDQVSNDDFTGKPLVLNFWASWCFSCREEASVIEQFWQKHKADDFALVGVAIQDEQESAQKFAKHFGKSYLLVIDEDGSAGINYGVIGVPETFFIDRKGVVRHKVAGPLSTDELEKWYAVISE